MSKINKSTVYKSVKVIREDLTNAFKAYQTSKDTSALKENLVVVSDKLLKLIDEANQ